ncbi:MAG: hypothetical protein J4F49_11085 [Rhodobacteraceae bacterium]|nr:hypothetical protein [Paracoccaceae bacterium]
MKERKWSHGVDKVRWTVIGISIAEGTAASLNLTPARVAGPIGREIVELFRASSILNGDETSMCINEKTTGCRAALPET